MRAEPTQERVREALHYDPENGVLTNRAWRGGTARAGSVAGTVARRRGTAYRRINLDGLFYYAHRLAWLYVHGEWPSEIDHINGDGLDNRLVNLRPVTSHQNHANRHKIWGVSRYKGVNRSASKRNPWRAEIQVKGRSIYLGVFPSQEAAARAYDAAAREHFGEFARTNFEEVA